MMCWLTNGYRLGLLLILFIASCNIPEKKFPSPYGINEPSMFLETDSFNINNEDNILYLPKTVYQYKYQYFDSLGQEQRIVVTFNDECIEDRTVNCNDWILFPLDLIKTLSSDKFFPIDYIEMYICESTMNNSLSNQQTVIKYSYFNDENGRILFGEITGLIEDKEQIFLHPPRMYGFSILELVPFPLIKLPILENSQWQTEISIPLEMVKKTRLGIDSPLHLSSSYTVVSIVESDYLSAEIHAINTNYSGNVISEATFTYDSRKGITKIECKNIDSSRLILHI